MGASASVSQPPQPVRTKRRYAISQTTPFIEGVVTGAPRRFTEDELALLLVSAQAEVRNYIHKLCTTQLSEIEQKRYSKLIDFCGSLADEIEYMKMHNTKVSREEFYKTCENSV